MFKPIPVAIGLRYLRAKRRNSFIWLSPNAPVEPASR